MNQAGVCSNLSGRKKRKRRGRGNGSGLGKTSGRGHKGALSRSGWKRRWFAEGGQMPLYRRLPKKGFNNARFRDGWDVVNVGDLEGFAEGDEVNLQTLEKRGIVKPRFGRLKVLGGGEVKAALRVKASKFSKSARSKIENAGGKTEVG